MTKSQVKGLSILAVACPAAWEGLLLAGDPIQNAHYAALSAIWLPATRACSLGAVGGASGDSQKSTVGRFGAAGLLGILLAGSAACGCDLGNGSGLWTSAILLNAKIL